jgi:hypothetical protein
MKNLTKVLIVVAAIVTLVAIVSRLTITPVAGIQARPMVGFAGLLLLFAIALEGLK